MARFQENDPYTFAFGDRLNVVDRCENSHWDKGLKGIDCHSFMQLHGGRHRCKTTHDHAFIKFMDMDDHHDVY